MPCSRWISKNSPRSDSAELNDTMTNLNPPNRSRPSGIEEKAVNSRNKILESALMHAKQVIEENKRFEGRYAPPPTERQNAIWEKTISMQTAMQIRDSKLRRTGITGVKNSYASLDSEYYKDSILGQIERQKHYANKGVQMAYTTCNDPTSSEKKKKSKRKPVKIVHRVRTRKGEYTEYYTTLPEKVNSAVMEEYSKKLGNVVEKHQEKLRQTQISKTRAAKIFKQCEFVVEDNNQPQSCDEDNIQPQSYDEVLNYFKCGAPKPDVAKPVLKHIELFLDMIVLMHGAKSWPYALLQVKTYIAHTLNRSIASEAYQIIYDIWGLQKENEFDVGFDDEAYRRLVMQRSTLPGTYDRWSNDPEFRPDFSEPNIQVQVDMEKTVERVKSAANQAYGTVKGTTFVGTMEAFKLCFRDFQAVQSSEFVKRLKKMVAFVVALGACEVEKVPLTFMRFEEYYKTSGIADLHWSEIWTGIIDTVLYIYDRGVALFKGEHYMDIIGTARGATNYESKYASVVGNIYLYESCQLEKVKLDPYVYEKYLEELETETRMLHTKLSGPEKRIAANKMCELTKIRARVVSSQLSMPMREAPYSFYLYGTPGVGKSVVMAPIIQYLMKLNGLDSDLKYIANIRLDDAYQTEIQEYHTVVVVDDIANTKAAFEKTPTGQAIIDYVNNNPRYALKADVDSKGKVLLKPKIFAVTGNTPEVEASIKSNEPLSILRRLGVRITVEVKEAYRPKGSNMIDPEKMTNIVNDAWNFTVEKAMPTGHLTGAGASCHFWEMQKHDGVVLKQVGMETLLKYLGATSKKHFTHQAKLLRDANDLTRLELCPHDLFASVCSTCQHNQTMDIDIQSAEDVYASLKYAREWSYAVADSLPVSLKENLVLNHLYSRLNALGRFEKGVTGMRVFSFVSGGFAMMLTSLFTATTPVVVTMGVLLSTCSYVYLSAMRVHSGLKKLKNATFMTLQPLVCHKYKWYYGGAAVAATIAAVILALKMFRPVANATCGSMLKKATSRCCCKMDLEGDDEQGSYDAEEEVTDGIVEQVGFVPKPDSEPRVNVYAIPNVEPVKVRHQLATMNTMQMNKVVEGAIAFARFTLDTGSTAICDIFPLKGNTWIVPYHMMCRNPVKVQVVRAKGHLNNNRECLITPSTWKRVGDSDLCVICLVSVGEVLDTSGYFMDDVFPRSTQSVKWILKTEQAEIMSDEFCALFSMVTVPNKWTGQQMTYTGWHYNMGFKTQEGFCMAALVSQGKVPYILGFHSAGDSSSVVGRGHFVRSSELLRAYDGLFTSFVGDAQNINVQVASQGDMQLDFPEYGIKCTGELHPKSPFLYLEEGGHVELYGAHTGQNRRFTSRCVPTYISTSVEKHCGIPRMHGPPKNMNSYKPWRADVLAVLPSKQLDQEFLGKAYADIEERYVSFYFALPEHVKKNIRPLGVTAVLSGVDGVFGIDAIKLATSAGFPRCKPKRNYVHESTEEVEGITRPLEMDEEILKSIEAKEKILAEGYRVYCKFRVSLKDEPTKLSKDKVRTFAGADLELLYMMRKYFLPLVKVMMDNPEFFACAVGVNAHGREWTKLARHLTRFGFDRTIAGDYAKFDSRMSNQLVLLAFKILIACARVLEWSEEELAIMTGLATEVSHGLCEYNGEYVLWHGQNLSGQAITVFINNMVNELYIGFTFYYAYHKLKNPDVDFNESFATYLAAIHDIEDADERAEFVAKWRTGFFSLKADQDSGRIHDNLSIMCYGDDNNMSVSETCTWFNHTVMAFVLSRFGVQYTMADKDASSVPFIRFEDSTFLKRRFVWSEQLQNYIAPLEVMSLYKTLHSCLKSKVLTEKEQSAEALQSVSRELFFHGREVFNIWWPRLDAVVEETELRSHLPKGELPRYQFYETEYIVKNRVLTQPEPSGGVVENGGYEMDTHRTCSGSVEQVRKASSSVEIAVQSGSKQIRTGGYNHVPTVRKEGVTSPYSQGVSTMIDPNQTMVFRDGVEQWETGIPSGWEDTRNVAMRDNPTFEDFFARPVVYNLPTWIPGQASPYAASFNPWSIFFTDKRVVNRLSNFNLAQTTLKVKFLINGNAFYYGRLIANYSPLNYANLVDPSNLLNKNVIIQASQKLKLFLNPTTSQGGVMSLPFFYYKNAAGLTVNEIANLGLIQIRELNGLKHANAGTDPVSIQAYIWSDNMALSIPTTIDASGIAPQAKDEYGSGVVSDMAFTAVKSMGKLESMPMIGKYAKSTAMVASGLGTIAKAFGFSRPAILADPTQIRPKLIGNLANTNVGDSVVKLTVDAKQEVSIDPSVTGAAMPDELLIKEIAVRESYITQFNWPIAATRNSFLFNIPVNPAVVVPDSTFTIPMIWAPACAFTSLPFKWWRGTMRYRFQIVASEYHKGRLRMVYDPNYIASLEGNIAMSRIIDLTTEKDFVMDISWGQPLGFAPVISTNVAGTTLIVASSPGSNGVLGVYVENDLTSPNTTINNDIQINVFVSTCDDIEYSVPSDVIKNITYSTQSADIQVQSSDEPALETDNAPVKDDNDDEIMSCLKVDHTYDVHFGESIQSFRQLLKRYAFHSSVLCPGAGRTLWVYLNRDFPRYRGKWADAVNAPVTGTVNVNNAYTVMMTYLTPAYQAYRGGVRWKYLYHTDNMNDVGYQTVGRYNTFGVVGYANLVSAPVTTNPSTFSKDRATVMETLQSGGDVTYSRAQPALEVELPYYTPYRFSCAKHIGAAAPVDAPSENDLGHIQKIDVNCTATASLDCYTAAAEDFTLILFNGMPPYRYIDLST